jgi:hypothetical protein
MKRSGPIQRTAMKPYRPTVTTAERNARDLVRARSGGWCEVRLPDICLGRAANMHHRKNRSQGGHGDAANLVDLCGSGTTGCHGALTDTQGQRAEYEAHGWIVPREQEPAEVPVLLHNATTGHEWVLLDDQGDVAFAPFPEPASGDPFELPVPPSTAA